MKYLFFFASFSLAKTWASTHCKKLEGNSYFRAIRNSKYNAFVMFCVAMLYGATGMSGMSLIIKH